MIDLKAIKERAEKATAGPWVSKKFGGYHHIYKGPVKVKGCGLSHKGEICEMEDPDCSERSKKEINANADFIANSRQDIPALLDYIYRLEAFVNVVRQVDDSLMDTDMPCGEALDLSYALAILDGRALTGGTSNEP